MESINIDQLAKKIGTELISHELFSEDELINSINEAKLDLLNKYERPIALIQFIEDNGIKKDILTTANISTTIGGAKSKKTFFSTILLASLLGCNDYAISGNLWGKIVIFFDTEQTHYHVQRINYRIKKLLGDVNNMEIFALRPYTPEKRLAIVDYHLKNNAGNVSFVIIDGIVDLLYDFNDIKESKRLSTKLLEWSAIYKCHINTVLHTNKDKMNARGHLGTELMNKSETVFRVEKEDQDVSIVSNEMSRNEGFEKFRFKIESGIPKRCDFPLGYFDNKPKRNDLVNIANDYSDIISSSIAPF